MIAAVLALSGVFLGVIAIVAAAATDERSKPGKRSRPKRLRRWDDGEEHA